MIRWLIFFLFTGLLEIYTWQAVKVVFENKWIHRIYLILSFLVFLFILISLLKFDRKVGQNQLTLITFGLLLLVYLPKLIITVFLLSEDIFRVLSGSFRYFSSSSSSFLPERRKFISQLSLGIAAIPFLSLIHGISKGRYNFKVKKSTVFFDDLPFDFDGLKILHLSDFHVGSLDNPEKIKYGINLINQQNFDLLVFTGDIVNSHASEMDDWYTVFSEIKTPQFGKFSILGNHDYGEYLEWDSQKEKEANFKAIQAIHPKIGFDLLLNENRKIRKGNSEITLIGVENWGEKFKKAGDLAKASENINSKDFKILLTHDPSHWDIEVQNHPLNYQLTLCGHTHGMQFGIEIPGYVKWSPVQYVYKHWAGLYQNKDRYLYVNRGFGYHAYPGRVGIWPEITLLEIKKKN